MGERARLLVVAPDVVGERMAGPGIRAWEIARALSTVADVCLASPHPVGRSDPRVRSACFAGDDELVALAAESDVVLVQGLALLQFPLLALTDALRVADLYDPFLFSNLELRRDDPQGHAEAMHRLDEAAQNDLLDAGDAFVCASERQRDFWLGALSARGRVERRIHALDPTLRALIDLVPYGCPLEPPGGGAPKLRGMHPRIPEDAYLLVWSGGTWDWFDPISVLEAFARVLREEPRARLYFMGLELEGRDVPEQRVTRELVERAEALGLAGDTVIFGGWVPYDERGAYLLEADAAVLATRETAELRLAFRSRVVDHFWAGLPTLTTRGDELSELIEHAGAGLVVSPGDVDGLAEGLIRLSDPAAREPMAASAARLADRFRWGRAVAPLRRLLRDAELRRALLGLRAPRRPANDVPAVAAHRELLVEELERSAAERELLHGELGALRADRDVLADELNALRRDREALADQLSALRHDRDLLAEELEVLREDRNALAGELGRVRHDRDLVAAGAEQDVEALRLERAALEQELDAVRQDRELVAAELAAVRRDRDALAAARDQLLAELEAQDGVPPREAASGAAGDASAQA